MKSFPIFPTEALLLGQCFGEYNFQYDAQNSETYFAKVCQKRLRPYCETFRVSERVSVLEDDIPDDIQWEDRFLNDSIVASHGWAPTSQDAYFYRDEDGAVFRTTWQTSRKSFLDLLNLYLDEAIGRTLADYDAFPRPGENRGKTECDVELGVWDAMVELIIHDKCLGPSPRPTTIPDHQDKRKSVRDLLASLAKDSGCWGPFMLGLGFGVAIGQCYKIVQIFRESAGKPYGEWKDEYMEECAILDKWLASMQRNSLIADPVNDSINSMLESFISLGAESMLMRLDYGSNGIVVPSFDPLCLDLLASLAEVQALQERIWLCFGSVLGYLRAGNEGAERNLEHSSAAPRTWTYFFDESGDKVKKAVAQAEEWFGENADSEDLARTIITQLQGVIEAIARRLHSPEQPWPGLNNFLHGFLHQGSRFEQRFAGIGLVLLKQYRNPVAHEFASFSATMLEARFFTDGIRTMLELSDRILESRGRPDQ